MKMIFCYIFIIIAVLSIYYKAYLQIKIHLIEKKISNIPFIFLFPYFMAFPLWRPYTKNEEVKKMVKKANISLGIFYFSFIISLLITLI
jgi:hypothetical protein